MLLGDEQECLGQVQPSEKDGGSLESIKAGKERVQPLILDPTIPHLTRAWNREVSAREAEGNNPKERDCFSLGPGQSGSGMSHSLAHNSMKKRGKFPGVLFHPTPLCTEPQTQCQDGAWGDGRGSPALVGLAFPTWGSTEGGAWASSAQRDLCHPGHISNFCWGRGEKIKKTSGK